MKIITPLALAVAALAGCKTAPHPGTPVKAAAPRPRTEVERQLSSLMGADLSAAVGILGFPDQRRQSTGTVVYVWSTGRSQRLPMSEIRMGSYDDHAAGGGPCRVELEADDHGRISGYSWSGTDGVCSWVLQAFNRAEFEADKSR